MNAEEARNTIKNMIWITYKYDINWMA
jgi:hypothetical protein